MNETDNRLRRVIDERLVQQEITPLRSTLFDAKLHLGEVKAQGEHPETVKMLTFYVSHAEHLLGRWDAIEDGHRSSILLSDMYDQAAAARWALHGAVEYGRAMGREVK